LSITKAKTNFPKNFIHRTLDDVPVVAPGHTDLCEQFTSCYKDICDKINVKLAPNCPMFDKAFSNSTYGKVLGIHFDSTTLSWSTPVEKKNKAILILKKVLDERKCNLKTMQELLGRINDIVQMCPFLRGFRFKLNELLALLHDNPESNVFLNAACVKDLKIFLNFLLDKEAWLPIPAMYCNVPLSPLIFVSDAAGCSIDVKIKKGLGCGNIGLKDGRIFFANQLIWPEEILLHAIDEKKTRLGDKTTTLEFLGIIIPFVTIPEKLTIIML
jgi:hypothetical protein